MGENLVFAWDKSVRGAKSAPASAALVAVEGKVAMLCRFLGDDDDDVSSTVCPFAMSYIGILKRLKPLTEKQKSNVQVSICLAMIRYGCTPDRAGHCFVICCITLHLMCGTRLRSWPLYSCKHTLLSLHRNKLIRHL